MQNTNGFLSNEDITIGNCLVGILHPTRELSRALTNDVQRQNINVRHELSDDIDKYLRWME